MNRRLAVLLPTIALAAAVACGSSSSGNGNAGTQNEGGAGGSSGSTGSSGSSGSGTTTGEGDTGTPSSAPVVCGGTTCNAPSGGVVPLSSCCQTDNTCGATFSGGGLGGLGGAAGGAGLPADAGLPCLDTSAGTPDSTCPSQTLMGFSLAGCCTKSGVCGTNLSMVGLGCNSLSAIFGGAGGGLGGTPVACGAGADGSAPPISDAAPTSDAVPE
jgi:hypothetical protein